MGTDDDGYPVKLKMRHFFKYCRDHYDDDSPLYVFESRFAERKALRHMAQDFEVPCIHWQGTTLYILWLELS